MTTMLTTFAHKAAGERIDYGAISDDALVRLRLSAALRGRDVWMFPAAVVCAKRARRGTR